MKFRRYIFIFFFLFLSVASAENLSPLSKKVYNRLSAANSYLNFDGLVHISWNPQNVKVALRNDWLENLLTQELLKTLKNHPDIKWGEGYVRLINHNPQDSTLFLHTWFHVIPKKVPFEPRIRCNAYVRIHMKPDLIKRSIIEVLDREPIKDCEVNGALGQTLNLGDWVKNKLNDKIASLPAENFFLKIGESIFQDSDLVEKMGRMYLLKELEPYTFLSLDDCSVPNAINVSSANFVCLQMKWPLEKFSESLNNILAMLEPATPAFNVVANERIQHWKSIAPLCEHKQIPYPSKGNCETGDMTLFSGLLCLSGEEEGCKMVADSLDQKGQWWRSPHLIGSNEQTNDFSGDMFAGAMAYLHKTKDIASYNRWVNFLLANTKDIPAAGTPRLTFHRSCFKDTNGTCQLMGDDWYWLKRLGNQLGVNTDHFPDYGYEPSWLLIQSLTNERGFRLHLVAVAVLNHLHQKTKNVNIDLAAKVLSAREPENPFFRFLAFGKEKRVFELLDKYCPAFGSAAPTRQHQWSWEREIEDKAYESSMGWDCVFMANLINGFQR
ncbi:hypothetical protein [Bdellovibrio reynosensis]|uniref:Uncharacterized protein n=1 Tax=Bdellovibrio reynosensis TaxID=2835041 RepID=A0ABY4C979_9BACT|nr:hypothetical protein [Bdellovibrio reynosensis]UOF01339.1 hypothetical protein MNR06_00025 [Bdellovibrio reynosensis]